MSQNFLFSLFLELNFSHDLVVFLVSSQLVTLYPFFDRLWDVKNAANADPVWPNLYSF